ncbi:hypothetical protein HAHE_12910 [Haloferula helveola]|uniref:Uncharacterized protein n=1 Tax=Haloferula helveola TaxID=490095 RepID=A0ABM7RIE5_9BACT|nr:hypothetical protein HAHE_12910 [Haloferula helveola]
MAQRIDDAVVRGEICNRVEGKTTGRIWLRGRSEPVVLDLVGDCWRDLAGARLTFTNPEPEGAVELGKLQKGVVGDMTASRKCRVPLCPIEEFLAREAAGEEVPVVWKNMLYIEWFSDTDGRVVIESTDYQLELSEHAWRMDGDAEEAQKLANLQAMRDFLNVLIARRPRKDDSGKDDDEFEWERRLRDSDRLTEAYQEVLEKYMNDPDAERKEAFVMGWDGLLEAMAEEEAKAEAEYEDSGDEDWEPGDDEEHPLQQEAEALALRACDLVPADGEDARGLVSALGQVAGRLSGALSGSYERETGFILAVLKRCVSLQNDAVLVCTRLITTSRDADQARALEALRDQICEMRNRLIDMRRELRGS